MAAADIYVTVPEVCFGPDPHCDVMNFFMQRLGFLSTTTKLQPNSLSININSIRVTTHLQKKEQGLSAFYVITYYCYKTS